MAAKYELYKGSNSQYYFRLKAGNGETILSSEGYVAKTSAANGVESVRKHSTEEKYFDKLASKDNRYYFTLKAVNGQVIGISQMYSSTSARDGGIKSVQQNGSATALVDLT